MIDSLTSCEKLAELNGRLARLRLPVKFGVWLSTVLFVVLLATDIFRALHHAMWHDEILTFGVARYSSSLFELWRNLKYEGHPALWYVLVWPIARFTADPTWMAGVHAVLAALLWIFVFVCSPFSRLEKFLLLLSYFLFWEYFVITRSYVLVALIGFIFIAMRERPAAPKFALWPLLGLLANVHLFGTIWSISLALTLAAKELRPGAAAVSASLTGAALYLLLVAFAVLTMWPAPVFSLSSPTIGLNISRLGADLATPLGAFVPFSLATLRDSLTFMAHPYTAEIPRFWNSTPIGGFVALTRADADHLVRLALTFAAPIALCWLVVRNASLVLEFALTYVGVVLFENIWNFPGVDRHHGIIFLVFAAAAWSARSRQAPGIWSRRLFGIVLFVNAVGGLLTLSSELRPFSEGREAAAWIKNSNLSDEFLIGSHDEQVATVSVYLGRSVYFLGCECSQPIGIWNDERREALSAEEFAERLSRAFALAGLRGTVLILTRPVTEADLAPGLAAVFLKSFTNASTGERYWIYRLHARQASL